MSDTEKAFKEMYDLGYKHGYTMAEKDMEIERLQKELSTTPQKRYNPKPNYSGAGGTDGSETYLMGRTYTPRCRKKIN